MKPFSFVIIALIIFSSTACHGCFGCHGFMGSGVKGKGPTITEQRTVSNFTGIESEIAADISIKVGTEYACELEGQRNILDLIKTNVENGVLHIHCSKNIRINKGLKIRISAPAYDKLSMKGVGAITSSSPLNGDNLNIVNSGAGAIKTLDIHYKTINAIVSGAGGIELAGDTPTADFKLSGAGNIDASNCKVANATTRVSGVGNISCFVTDTLDASVSGVGSINYKGEPKNLQSHVSGIGGIHKM